MGSGWNPFVDAVLGQWQVNGIFSLAYPNQQSNQQQLLIRWRPETRFEWAKGDLDNPTIARWFDTTAFQIAPNYTFGTMGRVHPTLKNDRVENLDLSIFKSFRFTERHLLQFRAEAFNLIDHPVFGTPGNTVGAGNFGVVASQANPPRQIQLALRFLF